MARGTRGDRAGRPLPGPKKRAIFTTFDDWTPRPWSGREGERTILSRSESCDDLGTNGDGEKAGVVPRLLLRFTHLASCFALVIFFLSSGGTLATLPDFFFLVLLGVGLFALFVCTHTFPCLLDQSGVSLKAFRARERFASEELFRALEDCFHFMFSCVACQRWLSRRSSFGFTLLGEVTRTQSKGRGLWLSCFIEPSVRNECVLC